MPCFAAVLERWMQGYDRVGVLWGATGSRLRGDRVFEIDWFSVWSAATLKILFKIMGAGVADFDFLSTFALVKPFRRFALEGLLF